MELKKWCPNNVLIIIFTIGCIAGICLAFKTLTTTTMSLFERILEGIITPLAYGFTLCLAYSIAAFFVGFVIEQYMKEKTFLIIVIISSIAIGLFFAFTITG